MWKELALVIPVDLERLNPVIPATVERAGFCYQSCCGKSHLLLQMTWKELTPVIPAEADLERAGSCYPR
jgi:hypothetical protein